MRDFNDNDFPLAYLITFRCYGTWLHGDERGSYRRSSSAIEGVVRVPPRPRLKQAEVEQLKHNPTRLDKRKRREGGPGCLSASEVLAPSDQCQKQSSSHCGFSNDCSRINPQYIQVIFDPCAEKEWLAKRANQPWARHGSTIYLWKEEDVARAIAYGLLGQDHPFT